MNYDGFQIAPDLEAAYIDAIKKMSERYYHGVTRFTTNAFLRSRLGATLKSGGIEPRLYESRESATDAVADVS